MPSVSLGPPVDFNPFPKSTARGSFDNYVASAGEAPVVSPDVQAERDSVRQRILADEGPGALVDPEGGPSLDVKAPQVKPNRGTQIASEVKKTAYTLGPPVSFDPFADDGHVAPSDVTKAVASGAVNVATTGAELAKFTMDKLGFTNAASAAGEWRDTFQGYEKYWQDEMTDAGKSALAGDFSAHPFGTILLNAAQSAPGMIAMAGPAGLIAKGLEGTAVASRVATQLIEKGIAPDIAKAAGAAQSAKVGGVTGEVVADALKGLGVMSEKTAGTIGAAAPSSLGAATSEGVFSAAQNGAQSAQEVRDLPDDQLLQHPVAAAAMAALDPSIPYADRVRQVRNAMANAVESQVILRTAPWDALVALATGGGVIGRVFREGPGAVKGAIKGATSEAEQEFTQSYGEQVIQNLAAQNFYEQNRDPLAGAFQQAVIGAGAGGLMGAAGGGMHGATAPATATPPAQPPAPQAHPALGYQGGEPLVVFPDGSAMTQAQYQQEKANGMVHAAPVTPPESAPLSPIDQARADAQVLKSGGDLQADGERLKNATLVSVYGENAAVRHVIEGGQQFSAIGDAMLAAAPTVERVRSTISQGQEQRDITPDILDAIDNLAQVRASGQPLAEVMAHIVPHDISYEGQQLLHFLDENFDNSAKIANFLENYLGEVERLSGTPSQARGKAFDIIEERNQARKEKELADATALAERQKTSEVGRMGNQATTSKKVDAVNAVEATEAKSEPSAMELAFRNAKKLKGKPNVPGPETNPSVPSGSSGPSGSGGGQAETNKGNAPRPVSGAAKPSDEGNARPVGKTGNRGGAEEVNVVDQAAHEAATSPKNETPLPTQPQIDAGNYQKGAVKVGGLSVSIENPQGSLRHSHPESPVKWERKMEDHYGYVKGVPARAPDKEHVDVFVKPGTAEDYSGPVFVVDQNKSNGRYDEPKTIIGAASRKEARALYLRNYQKGFEKNIRGITQMTMAQFKEKLQDANAFLRPQGMQSDIPASLEITMPVEVEETGETQSVKMNARKAYRDTEKRVNRLESLLDCIS